MTVKHFNHLRIYNNALQLVSDIYLLCKTKNLEYEFTIISQIKRAVLSIPLNIAEGYGRKTNKDFAQFLSIALGSCNEVIALLDCVNAISLVEVSELKEKFTILSKQIYTLRRTLMK